MDAMDVSDTFMMFRDQHGIIALRVTLGSRMWWMSIHWMTVEVLDAPATPGWFGYVSDVSETPRHHRLEWSWMVSDVLDASSLIFLKSIDVPGCTGCFGRPLATPSQ
eukprot:9490122-Pyramimonas_sp.AAC.1